MSFLALSTVSTVVLVGASYHAYKKNASVQREISDRGLGYLMVTLGILALCNILVLTDDGYSSGVYTDGMGNSCSRMNQIITSVIVPMVLIAQMIIITKCMAVKDKINNYWWAAVCFMSLIVLYLFGIWDGLRCSTLADDADDYTGGIVYGHMRNSFILFLGMAFILTWPMKEYNGVINYVSDRWVFLVFIFTLAIVVPGAISWLPIIYAIMVVISLMRRACTRSTTPKK